MHKTIIELIDEAKERIEYIKYNLKEDDQTEIQSILHEELEKVLIGLVYFKTSQMPSTTSNLLKLAKEIDLPQKYNKYLKELIHDDFIMKNYSMGYLSHNSQEQEITQIIRKTEEILEWVEEEIED